MSKIGIIGMGHVGTTLCNIIPSDVEVIECDKNILPLYNYITKENINESDYVFICVPTPIGEDDMLDISEIKEVFTWCTVKNICIKSTIPVGTIDFLNQLYPNRNIVFSPEYYGETNCHPYAEHGADWLVLGGEPEATKIFANLMQRWYPSNAKIHITDAKTAELAKFMENSFLATKVSFCNQFYDIAKAFDVDYFKLRETWLLDPRIGESHTMVYPEERGYGGKCLPKDIQCITTQGKLYHTNVDFLNAVIEANKVFNKEINMNQEMQNVANTIMYTAIMHDKKQEELENKARKYDALKEAVGKIKEEIRETYDEFRDNDVLIANGIKLGERIIKKHTEGLL